MPLGRINALNNGEEIRCFFYWWTSIFLKSNFLLEVDRSHQKSKRWNCRKAGCRYGWMNEKSKSKSWMAEKLDGQKSGWLKSLMSKSWKSKSLMSSGWMIIDNDSRKASKWNDNWKYPSCRETQNSLLPVNGNGTAAWGQQMKNDENADKLRVTNADKLRVTNADKLRVTSLLGWNHFWGSLSSANSRVPAYFAHTSRFTGKNCSDLINGLKLFEAVHRKGKQIA